MNNKTEISDLILTMIVSQKEYEGALNFTKIDIDRIIKKYKFNDINNIDCNELGWIILLENKYITNEMFAKKMDVEYIDGYFWTIIDDFSYILSEKHYETEISILNGDYDDWQHSSWYDADISYNWDEYTEETLKEIMEFCFRKGIEIEQDEEYELMDKNNTFLKNGKLYFKDQELVELIDDDELSELKSSLNNSICEAQDSADQDAYYEAIKKEFINKIGPFERKTVKGIDRKTKKEIDVDKIYVRLDFDMAEVKAFLESDYSKYDFTSENYGSLVHVLREMEFFDIKEPYYPDYGTIDKEYLNEITRDRLSWD